jgi:hypothetical protein
VLVYAGGDSTRGRVFRLQHRFYGHLFHRKGQCWYKKGVKLALAVAASGLLAVVCAQVPAKNRHVVVISIDGGASYSLKDPLIAVPNIRGLIRDGVAAAAIIPVNPMVTFPSVLPSR